MKISESVLKNILKNEGLRYTIQRQMIWDELKNSKEHRDAEDIFLELLKKKIKVSRATVYRTIDVLVKNSLVRKMELGDGRALYEPKLKNEHHDHMICTETGKIIEFFNEELEALQDKIVNDHGYEMVRHVHQLFVRPINKKN